ncbi:MAG: hypothetical protein ABW092_09650, partial [Candidatus Thiodiazotropha sp.]
CMAHNEKITLLPYFFSQTKYRPKHDPFLGLLKSTNFSMTKIWEPFRDALPNYTKADLPETLRNVEDVPMTDFISKVRNGRDVRILNSDHEKPFPLWGKVAIGLGVGLLLLVILVHYKELITSCLTIKCLGASKSKSAENRKNAPMLDCPPMAVTANDEAEPGSCGTPSAERPEDLPVVKPPEPVSLITVIEKRGTKTVPV